MMDDDVIERRGEERRGEINERLSDFIGIFASNIMYRPL
jgi:hypothetical protein